MNDPVAVLEVKQVILSLRKSNPPQVEIYATGLVSGEGWAKGFLEPALYGVADPMISPADGIQDYRFMAYPPEPAAGKSVSKAADPLYLVDACTVIPMKDVPAWFKGVRVHAIKNTVERTFGQKKPEKGIIFLKGVLKQGVECPLLVTDDGEIYSLSGQVALPPEGTTVYIEGQIIDYSYCMAGIPLRIFSIRTEELTLSTL